MTPDIKSYFQKLVTQKRGYKVLHAHLDKSNLITPEMLLKAQQASMQDKWRLYRDLKSSYTFNDVYCRAEKALHKFIKQDVPVLRTFADADSTVGQMCIDALCKLKEDYHYDIKLEIAIQPLEGVILPQSYSAFSEACSKADLVGGLPSRDKDPREHIRILFDLATKYNLPVDIHIDQLNDPDEIETEILLETIEETKFANQVNAIHCISLAAKPITYQQEIASRLAFKNVGVIVCPSAALSMRPPNKQAIVHNSIAPIQTLHSNNVRIALGIDNVSDLFMPLVDGDMWFECRLLMEAIRCYDLDLISTIATRYI